jgi:hypothetical protein
MQRAFTVLVIALCAMALPPLAAQQASVPAPAARANVAPANAASAPLPGPRLQPEYRSYTPSVPDSNASGNSSTMSSGSHTFVISTLALVLIVVIIVLLVAK